MNAVERQKSLRAQVVGIPEVDKGIIHLVVPSHPEPTAHPSQRGSHAKPGSVSVVHRRKRRQSSVRGTDAVVVKGDRSGSGQVSRYSAGGGGDPPRQRPWFDVGVGTHTGIEAKATPKMWKLLVVSLFHE